LKIFLNSKPNPRSFNSPSLVETVTAKGFTRAGFRVISAEAGSAEARAKTLKMSRSLGVATVKVFTKSQTSERPCAFCTANMRARNLTAEFL
jgi:hypothetical protein